MVSEEKKDVRYAPINTPITAVDIRGIDISILINPSFL
jgi:hypothetical protein